uniref:Uncharacterized protein n=1 Tax=Panagrolaimus davidi TaxID=227884 RepID=A0A914Q6N4_9BILA
MVLSNFLLIFFGVLFFAYSGFCDFSNLFPPVALLEGNVDFRFVGNVRCKDGSPIQPRATLQLWEFDFLKDDLLLDIPLYRGKDNPYRTWWDKTVYAEEGWEPAPWMQISFAGAEVYYKFLHVCFDGQEVLAEPAAFSPDKKIYEKDYVL